MLNPGILEGRFVCCIFLVFSYPTASLCTWLQSSHLRRSILAEMSRSPHKPYMARMMSNLAGQDWSGLARRQHITCKSADLNSRCQTASGSRSPDQDAVYGTHSDLKYSSSHAVVEALVLSIFTDGGPQHVCVLAPPTSMLVYKHSLSILAAGRGTHTIIKGSGFFVRMESTRCGPLSRHWGALIKSNREGGSAIIRPRLAALSPYLRLNSVLFPRS